MLGRIGWVGRGDRDGPRRLVADPGRRASSSPDEAKGFDGALREVTGSTAGRPARRLRRRRPRRSTACSASSRRRASDSPAPTDRAAVERCRSRSSSLVAAVVAALAIVGAVRGRGRARPGRPGGRGALAGPAGSAGIPGFGRSPRVDRPASRRRADAGRRPGDRRSATALAVGLVFDMVDRQLGLARWDRPCRRVGQPTTPRRGRRTVLDRLTDLGGTPVVVVRRRRRGRPVDYVAPPQRQRASCSWRSSLVGVAADQQRAQVARRPRAPRRPAPRRHRRVVVPVRALGRGRRGLVRRSPSSSAVTVVATGRPLAGGGCRPDHRRRRGVPGPARRPLAHRRRRRRARRLGLVPAQRAGVRRTLAALGEPAERAAARASGARALSRPRREHAAGPSSSGLGPFQDHPGVVAVEAR